MSRVDSFRVVDVQEYMPEKLEPGVLYISSEQFGVAIHLCAGGCGTEVVMPTDGPHAWAMTRVGDEVTFTPSILQGGCGHHYFIEQNRVRWC